MSVLTTKLRRDLGRSKGQFIAITITIFLGITLFGGSFDAYRSLEASYEQLYDDLDFANLWVVDGNVAGFADSAARDSGVTAVSTRHQADTGIRPVPGRTLFGRLVGLPLGSEPEVNRVLLLEGTQLESAGSVVVDHHMSDHFGLAIGDTIEIANAAGEWKPFTISGIAASAEYLWPAPSRQQVFSTPDDFGVVFLADAVVVDLAGAGAVAQAVVRYDDKVPASDLDDRLTDLAIGFGATDTYTRAEQASNSALQEDVKGFGDLAFMFPILFLTAAGLGAWVMLTRLVMTQLPVIGTLMANGMRRRKIFSHYLSYGVVVGLTGAIPGVIAGALMAWGIAGVYTAAINVPITVIKIDLTTPLQGLAFGLFAGLIAAAFPAWRAISRSPAEALRGARPTGTAKPTVLERVFPPLRRLPTAQALVLRNVFRNKRRTLTTMLGVVLSLTLILVSWGMIDTIDVLLERQFQAIERSDARVVLVQPANAATLDGFLAIEGVTDAEAVVSLDVAIEANRERYGTSLQGYDTDTDMHGFLDSDGELELPDTGVLLGRSLRNLLGISVGDTVTVHIPSLGLAVDEVVAGFVDEPLGTYAYASNEHLTELLVESSAAISIDDLTSGAIEFGAALRFADGTEFESIRADIESIPGVVAALNTRAIEDTMNSFMGLFYAFVGVMLAFGGMLAFGIIFNTMSVNLAERQVEVATMQAAGVTEGTVARLITAENMLVTLVGIVPGLVFGFLIAQQFMAAYDTDQFTFTLSMRWTTLVLSALFIVVVTLVSQWPGLRAIRRLDIAKIVRERAV
jgi:putative ABC transport system permease protein